jgi:methyl-accepting chemotaxis protein
MDPTVETTGRKGARGWWLTTLLVLALLTFGGIYSLWALGRAHQWVSHTDEVRVVLADLQSTLVDAESGMRGYAVAGDPAFLDASERARAAWEPRFARLRALTQDNPRQGERLDQLGTLLRQRFLLVDELRVARQTGHQGSELTPVMTEGGRATEQIRRLIHDMDQEESRLEAVRQRDALNRWRWTLVLFIGGAFAFSVVVFTTSLRRREAEARRLGAEEVSRASELFRVVLQGTDLGVTVQDPSGRLVYANDAAARLVVFFFEKGSKRWP